MFKIFPSGNAVDINFANALLIERRFGSSTFWVCAGMVNDTLKVALSEFETETDARAYVKELVDEFNKAFLD